MNRRIVPLCLLLATLIITTACGISSEIPPTPAAEATAIDPVFREFYNYLGGRDLLGDAIAASTQEGGLTSQYVETARMVFDPSAAPVRRFRLEPLGAQMGVSEPPVPPPPNPQLHYDCGHVIFPDFYPLYEKLGAQTVGCPLTEVRHNMIRRRYEQFFENLGFYRLEGTSEVRLLTYGVWACNDCGAPQTVRDATIDVRGAAAVHPAFQTFVEQQGADFTGFALQGAGLAVDGKWEQILENVVLVTDSQAGQHPVDLRPLSEALHIPADAPRAYSGDPNMYFFPTQGAELGYEIPVYFWEYIGRHGGMNIFGPPITHYSPLSGAIYHQCFRNLCLMYDPGATEEARIRPEPFGYAYKMLYGQPEIVPTPTAPVLLPTSVVLPSSEPWPTAAAPAGALPLQPTAPAQGAASMPTPTVDLGFPPPASTGGFPPAEPTAIPFLPPTPTSPAAAPMREITMQVWGRYNVVTTSQAQEISVWITENDLPTAGASVTLTVRLPDGTEQRFDMPATGANGQSSLMLPPIAGPDSTLIPYRACYQTSADTRMCIADFFMIWNNP